MRSQESQNKRGEQLPCLDDDDDNFDYNDYDDDDYDKDNDNDDDDDDDRDDDDNDNYDDDDNDDEYLHRHEVTQGGHGGGWNESTSIDKVSSRTIIFSFNQNKQQ